MFLDEAGYYSRQNEDSFPLNTGPIPYQFIQLNTSVDDLTIYIHLQLLYQEQHKAIGYCGRESNKRTLGFFIIYFDYVEQGIPEDWAAAYTKIKARNKWNIRFLSLPSIASSSVML